IAAALDRLDFEQDDSGEVLYAAGETLAHQEWELTTVPGNRGWPSAVGGRVAVAFDPELDDELLLEGDAYELIHRVNSLRKEQGLELTDRIVLTVPAAQAELADRHGDWIAREVLATSIDVGEALEIQKS